jgi:hypothetical protein
VLRLSGAHPGLPPVFLNIIIINQAVRFRQAESLCLPEETLYPDALLYKADVYAQDKRISGRRETVRVPDFSSMLFSIQNNRLKGEKT